MTTPDEKYLFRTRAVANCFRRAQKKDPKKTNIKFVACTEDSWYFVYGDIKGTNGLEVPELKDGQYLGVVTAQQDYPIECPTVKFLTPTGVYPVNSEEYCTSIGGHYHKSDYLPTLGMDGYALMICSALDQWRLMGKGINLKTGLKSNDLLALDIIEAAQASKEYNATHYPEIMQMFH